MKWLIKLCGGYTREELNLAKTLQAATSSQLAFRKCQDIAMLNRAKAKKYKQRTTEHDKTVESITALLVQAGG